MCHKGYGFSSGCARESVKCQKLCKIGHIFGATRQQWYLLTTFQQYLCHKGYLFLQICASQGMDLGPYFVPVRVGFRKFCASEGRGFAVPSQQGYTFSGQPPPPGMFCDGHQHGPVDHNVSMGQYTTIKAINLPINVFRPGRGGWVEWGIINLCLTCLPKSGPMKRGQTGGCRGHILE